MPLDIVPLNGRPILVNAERLFLLPVRRLRPVDIDDAVGPVDAAHDAVPDVKADRV